MLACAALVVGSPEAKAGPEEAVPLPDAVTTRLPSSVRLSADDHDDLAAGKVVLEEIKSDVRHETVAFVIARVQVSLSDAARFYEQADILMESSEASQYGAIGDPATASAFGDLRLLEKDLDELPKCRVGKCKVKLDATWMRQLLQKVGWRSEHAEAEANELFGNLLADLAGRYQLTGDSGLLSANDKSDSVSIGRQVRETVENSQNLRRLYPELYRHLVSFPNERIVGAEDKFFWMLDELRSGKRAIQMVHRVLYRPAAGELVVATKQIYANHYFESAVGFTVIVPAREPDAVYVMAVYRARIDSLRGFGLFNGRVRSALRKLVKQRLEISKQRLQAAAAQASGAKS